MAAVPVVIAQDGADRTFSTVAITQAQAGFLLLKGLVAGKTPKLHAMVLTGDTAATTIVVQSCTADNGGGTNTAITGIMPLAQYGGFVIPFCYDARGCLGAASGAALGMTSATGKVFGYAVVSTD
jgi:hypothetical protein